MENVSWSEGVEQESKSTWNAVNTKRSHPLQRALWAKKKQRMKVEYYEKNLNITMRKWDILLSSYLWIDFLMH